MFWKSTLAALAAIWLALGLAPAAADSPHGNPGFQSAAEFRVNDDVHQTVAALAWVEEHPQYGDEYRILRIGFYPFPLSEEQIRNAEAGNYQPIEDRVTADNQSADYKSHVRVILLIDEDNQVLQVNMSLPGYACTIMHEQPDLDRLMRGQRIEDDRLRLRSKGSFECSFIARSSPANTFHWNFDVDLPVFEISSR